ncbi:MULTISPECIES: helix-turn-helix domain-containing protein [Weeksellaceae]|uniref:helix-turn-helix domain-containing protein n=1 Tax=Weeksellaceae TaxID=2762318 RepID=UPI00099A595B|nr:MULTISPECIES: helix-turn-helix domain-containing protein [Elizabethkingia]OPB96478.1 excisionase [Elizabethkingia occulta]OPC18966.1 excisionase [Elizabethkingia bruuniana]
MGFSKLKIPRVCEHCSKPFEAKTVTTRFCSLSCANKAGKERKKLEKEQKEKETLLNKYSDKIAEVQTREFISVAEAKVMFGISKDTLHRLIKRGMVTSVNLGVRLTRVKRLDLEALFTSVEIPSKKEEKAKPNFEVGNCYTITEISEKFNADPSTIYHIIKRNKIPTKKVGSFVYVPKVEIDKIFANT